MKYLLKVDKDQITLLFPKRGFQLEKEGNFTSFGDSFLQFEKRNLLVRVLSDKGINYLEVSAKEEPETWHDLGLIKALISGSDRLLEPPSMNADLTFLFERLDDIFRMFEPTQLEHTKTLLKKIRALRAHRMFPYWY